MKRPPCENQARWLVILVSLVLLAVVSLAGCAESRPANSLVLYVYTTPYCRQCEIDKPIVARLQSAGVRVKYIRGPVPIYPFYVLVDASTGTILVQSNYIDLVVSGAR